MNVKDSQDTEDIGRGAIDLAELATSLKHWGRELGFGAVAIAGIELDQASARLRHWLAEGRHGEMDYMARHAELRADPARILPGALRVITARMDYLPRAAGHGWIEQEWQRLADAQAAAISIYARGRDYHKVLRARLQQLATRIEQVAGPYGYRVATDSAPVMEVELAQASGLGWRGKHTLLLSRAAGSTFFLGEILTDLPLPADAPSGAHCGSCSRCIEICPTQAITAPYQMDARRCISYLTIEHPGDIPEEFRAAIGNRVYGCDDCQLACPWNKFARRAATPDFDVRHGLDAATLMDLFAWSAADFDQRHAGSAIRRMGHERWLRNIAVALGNAPRSAAVIAALRTRTDDASALVRAHVAWALLRHGEGI
ncbi:MAG: tRNA epoxyqueuosine(34) reductase QueG [Burkholderiaceae bacterium]